MTDSDDRRVLIAGAGPAGCVAALILARAGIEVTLFEAEPELPTDLRASTFHPPTLDMLAELGLADRLVEQGLIAPTYQFRDRRSGDAATFDLSVLEGTTGYPFRLQCEQFKLTREAVADLEAEPRATILFGRAAGAVAQDEAGVTLTVDGPEGEEVHRGAFLIGADGASSAVRRACGVAFDGFTYPEQWVVASTPFDFAEAIPNLSPV
ncbi:MAG: NAD(P)/FAD-dependent oxidoreductase, partial [Pseudomonadota bacterium]